MLTKRYFSRVWLRILFVGTTSGVFFVSVVGMIGWNWQMDAFQALLGARNGGINLANCTGESFNTSTPRRALLSVQDIFLAVKTTQKYHSTRLSVLLRTWIRLANQSTYIFTDGADAEYDSQLETGHLVNTKCGSTYSTADLICKVSKAYDDFVCSNKRERWFCCLDDDTYVHVPNLVKLLQSYDDGEDWYIGKPSVPYPWSVELNNQHIKFWFATGGAMWCINRNLAERMIPFTLGKKMQETIRGMTDDTGIGFIIGHLMKVNLTVSHLLHSHYEQFPMMNTSTLQDQITLSYSGFTSINGAFVLKADATANVISTTGLTASTPVDEDPTRLLTLHSYLFPANSEQVPSVTAIP